MNLFSKILSAFIVMIFFKTYDLLAAARAGPRGGRDGRRVRLRLRACRGSLRHELSLGELSQVDIDLGWL